MIFCDKSTAPELDFKKKSTDLSERIIFGGEAEQVSLEDGIHVVNCLTVKIALVERRTGSKVVNCVFQVLSFSLHVPSISDIYTHQD